MVSAEGVMETTNRTEKTKEVRRMVGSLMARPGRPVAGSSRAGRLEPMNVVGTVGAA